MLVAYNDPIDQYLLRHPDYFFEQTPEAAVIDPENPFILAGHLGCAAFELPLTGRTRPTSGAPTAGVREALEAEKRLVRLDEQSYWGNTDFPAQGVNLRTISDDTFSIVDVTPADGPGGKGPPGERVIGNVDAISAPELVYPEAIYLHEGETYFVKKLDLVQRVAYVEAVSVDYYTQPVLDSSIRVTERREEGWRSGERLTMNRAVVQPGPRPCSRRSSSAATTRSATRTWTCRRSTWIPWRSAGRPRRPPARPRERRGAQVDGGPVGRAQRVHHRAAALRHVRPRGYRGHDRLIELRHAHALPLRPFRRWARLRRAGLPALGRALPREALGLIRDCPCDAGCPSCVGLPVLRPAIHQDPDAMQGFPIPDKAAALALLEAVVIEAVPTSDLGGAADGADAGQATPPGVAAEWTPRCASAWPPYRGPARR